MLEVVPKVTRGRKLKVQAMKNAGGEKKHTVIKSGDNLDEDGNSPQLPPTTASASTSGGVKLAPPIILPVPAAPSTGSMPLGPSSPISLPRPSTSQVPPITLPHPSSSETSPVSAPCPSSSETPPVSLPSPCAPSHDVSNSSHRPRRPHPHKKTTFSTSDNDAFDLSSRKTQTPGPSQLGTVDDIDFDLAPMHGSDLEEIALDHHQTSSTHALDSPPSGAPAPAHKKRHVPDNRSTTGGASKYTFSIHLLILCAHDNS